MRIDHAIWATQDRDAAAAHFERVHGLAAAGGGRHDGMGTHNRIVPLGGGYLELLAVADAEEAAGSPLGRTVVDTLASVGEGWMGWAVAVTDAEDVASRLGTELSDITRDGFSARLTGVAEALAEPALPFFVERGPGTPDPGEAGDAGGLPGSRSPATPGACASGSAVSGCPCASSRASRRCSRSASASASYGERSR